MTNHSNSDFDNSFSRPWTDDCLSFPKLEDYLAETMRLEVSALSHVRLCRHCRVCLYTLAEDFGVTKDAVDGRLMREWLSALRLVGVSFRDSLSEEVASLFMQYAPERTAILDALVKRASTARDYDSPSQGHHSSLVYSFCDRHQPTHNTTDEPLHSSTVGDERSDARLVFPVVHPLFEEEDVFSAIDGREWLNMNSVPFLRRKPVTSQVLTRALVHQVRTAAGYREFEAFQNAPIRDVLPLSSEVLS